jgi:hypothetical protein
VKETLDTTTPGGRLVLPDFSSAKIWFASVSLLDDGRYEVEFRDPTHRDHQLNTHTDPDKAANAVAHWAFHVFQVHDRLRRPEQENDF